MDRQSKSTRSASPHGKNTVAKPALPNHESIAETPDTSNYDLAIELSRGALSDVLAQADAIDVKAGFILGSATLLTGVLIAWKTPAGVPQYPAFLLTMPGQVWVSLLFLFIELMPFSLLALLLTYWVHWLPLAALVVYFLVMFTARKAYAPRPFKSSPHPSKMRSALNWPQERFREQAFDELEKVVKFNEIANGYKARWLNWAFRCFVLQAGLVAVILYFETLR